MQTKRIELMKAFQTHNLLSCSQTIVLLNETSFHQAMEFIEHLRRPSCLGKQQFLNYLSVCFLELLGDTIPDEVVIQLTMRLLNRYLDPCVFIPEPYLPNNRSLKMYKGYKVIPWSLKRTF